MKTIVICGSMKVKDKMHEVESELTRLGYGVILPNMSETGDYGSMTASEQYEFKNRMIIDHLDKIREGDAVLILNERMKEIDGYIGANSFLEIGFAFCLNRPVFLLNAIPDQPNRVEIRRNETYHIGRRPLSSDILGFYAACRIHFKSANNMKAKTIKITKENAEFQAFSLLRASREKRNKEGFLFEGVRNMNNAVSHKWKITSLFYSSERGISEWASGIIRSNPGATRYDLSPALLAKLSGKEEPSELLAVAEIPKNDLKRMPVRGDLLVVIFDSPSSPGNLGTIIRTCDALGAHGLIVTGHATDVYDPETISATTGSLFSIPIVRLPSQAEVMPWIAQMRKQFPDLQVVGTDERGDRTIYEHDFKKPTILLAGNEKRGLSAGYREICDVMAQIPMQGSASSLNVAVATSIVIAEARRQRMG